MKNKNMVFAIKLIISVCLLIAFYAAGWLVSDGLTDETINIILWVALAAVCTIMILALFSVIAVKIYKKHKNSVSAADMQKYLLQRKADAENSLKSVTRKIQLLRIGLRTYTLFILLIAAFIAFSMGTQSFHFGIALLSVYLFFGAIGRFNIIRPKADFSKYTDPEKYPYLHGIARKAAECFGIKGKIRIMIMPDCTAGIAHIDRQYSLQLGAIMLDVLSEQELYQVLLHEFAHMTPGCIPSEKESILFETITSRESTKFDIILDVIFSFFETLYAFEYSVYRTTASINIEKLADEAVLKYGDPEVAASALMKIHFYGFFQEYERMAEPFYKPESVRADGTTELCRNYKKVLSEREELWRNLVSIEIEPRSASHPILRNRLAAIGVSEARLIENNTAEPSEYHSEVQAAILEADDLMRQYNEESYEEMRKKHYLEPQEIVKKWEDAGRAVIPEESRPVIDALYKLCNYEEAEELCDRIISESQNIFATAHAHYIKGVLMIESYNTGGIEHIYKAIEINENYTREGLDIIGNTCCVFGLADELEKYREFAITAAQKEMDEHGGASSLNSSDALVHDEMPRDMLESIIGKMLSVENNNIMQIYLVRKLITADYFSSVFVVRFLADTDNDTVERVMNYIFNFLDTYPVDWQFSLFLYDSDTALAVKKVNGSLVYEAKNK